MSKFNEEYHPLLQNEESHICNTSPKFQRRFRCGNSGRARAQAKGAAYIITRWPDHLSKLLAYWWIGLGMIALLIFIIYNSILAIAIIPAAPLKSLNVLNRHFNVQNISHDTFPERKVYMHVLLNSYEEMIFKEYLPYVETFSKKYTNFTYNFVVLINDSSKCNIEDYSAELKNELALDSLWDEKQHNDLQMHKKPSVQIVSLSNYMDGSPLKKYWRDLPREFIGFLSRCIAIWNKGGIALNPIILTPRSPNPIYIQKLEEILGGAKVNISNSRKIVFKKSRRKVNNIQDIINNLQNEDIIDSFEANMVEEENKQKSYIEKRPHKSKRNTKLSDTKDNFISTKKYISQENKLKDLVNLKNANESHHIPNNKNYYKKSVPGNNDDDDKQNLLPMFLKFLFNRNSSESSNNSLGVDKYVTENMGLPVQKKIITVPETHKVENEFNSNNFTETSLTQNFIKENNIQKKSNRNAATLTIDLDGNLIASATPCHAFIGTVFSNIFHHTGDSPSIKDFIITELSLFCKGTLSSCTGIDVILV